MGSFKMPSGSRPAQIAAHGLGVHAPERVLVRDIDLDIHRGEVLAIVGPSGVGKSTFLRCLNRLVDLNAELRVTGDILFDGRSIRDPSVDPDTLRARIGMLFQQPVVFPRSIAANVLFGARHVRNIPRHARSEVVETALRGAKLWEEVAHRLGESALQLSVGQQQRLCLARALAVEPEILLMDEPTSALDADATAAIEALIRGLAPKITVVLVTHDLGQAKRVAQRVARFALRDGVGIVEAVGSVATVL